MSTQINRISGAALLGLSAIALITVITGFFLAPQADEGAAAHIFQLAVVALAPTATVFVATADLKKGLRGLSLLAYSGAILMLAFGSLYYLEHVFRVAH